MQHNTQQLNTKIENQLSQMIESQPKQHYLQIPQKQDQILVPISKEPQQQAETEPQHKSQVPIILLVAYLYFIQGVILSIGSTMPFIYPQVPNYSVLAIFALYTIPFSFKFISAPFNEKVNSPIYGKRKTWIVISQLFCSVLLFFVSYFTKQQQAVLLALIMLVTVFFVTLQDISLDALAIKQIKSTEIAGVLQSTMQTTGSIFGGLLLLKLTSLQFATNTLGRTQPLTTVDFLFKSLAVFIFIPTVMIHFLFRQTVLQSELEFNQNKSIWQTILYYKIFFNIKSKQCRMSILFLLYCQGFNLFDAGYQYELVKAGFSKDTLNTLGNVISIPVIVFTCLIGKIITKFGIKQILIIITVLSQIINIYLYVVFPTDTLTIGILIFVGSILGTARSLIISMMALGYPLTAVTAMTVTMLYSTSNFGRNLSLHTKLTGIFSWKSVALIGLVLQCLLILATYFYYDWMEKGDIGQDGQIIQQPQNNSNNN